MEPLLIYILVGFFAQLVDGSLGMGYKVSSTTFLLSTGISPVVASATVHTAGIFTSAAGGFSHWRLGNVHKKLTISLMIPGMIGAVLGVLVLTWLPIEIIKPLVAIYLLGLGLMLIAKAIWGTGLNLAFVQKEAVGGIGGFFDAIGGGGWGPIVTGTMMAKGTRMPRRVVGSSSVAEWFVTVVQAAAFFVLLHEFDPTAVVGLVLGGVPAAPIAALIANRLPVKKLMGAVGVILTLLSLRTLVLALTGG